MTSVNYKTKLKIELTNFSQDLGNLSIFPSKFPTKDGILKLYTVQNFKPDLTTSTDVFDSIERERIGYIFKPGRILFSLEVLDVPSNKNTVDGNFKLSDHNIMQILQARRIQFNVIVSSTSDNGEYKNKTVEFVNCAIDSIKLNKSIDGKPSSTVNIHALSINMEE